MRHTISLSLALALFWLLSSGYYTPLILSLGLMSIILVIFIAHKMDVVDHESQPIHLSYGIFGYYAWLTKEVFLANVAVVKKIWFGVDTISPSFTTITISQKTDTGKVIYANSITLTPGTVVVDLNDDQILVHSLMQENIQALEEGEMDRRVTRLEK